MLTLDKLKAMAPGEIFAKGVVSNSPEGVYMTGNDLGRELIWVAKRGDFHDWGIYLHWASLGEQYVINNGDKLTNKKYIDMLVPCEDQAFEYYRF